MVRVNRLTHKVLGIQMQLIFAEQTRQIIEMHHVLVTETHDLHNLVILQPEKLYSGRKLAQNRGKNTIIC